LLNPPPLPFSYVYLSFILFFTFSYYYLLSPYQHYLQCLEKNIKIAKEEANEMKFQSDATVHAAVSALDFITHIYITRTVLLFILAFLILFSFWHQRAASSSCRNK
jgi:hypothetical protein